jgi:hypothetical protein
MMHKNLSSGRRYDLSLGVGNKSQLFRMFAIASVIVVFSLFCSPLIARADTIQKSGLNDTIYFSKYFVQNNEWGNQYNNWGAGYQSISHDTNNDDIGAWSTTFNWWNVQSDDAYHIKAWPSIVQGWNWGAYSNNSGLPVQLWNNNTITSTWHFSMDGGSYYRADAIYDLWLHDSSDWNNPTDEIMIWPWYTDEDTGAHSIGQYIGTYAVDGENWDLYKSWNANSSPEGGWTVWKFVRQDKTTQVDNLHLNAFLGWLQWGIPDDQRISNSLYLTSIQAGTEIWYGDGWFSTDYYSVDIS